MTRAVRWDCDFPSIHVTPPATRALEMTRAVRWDCDVDGGNDGALHGLGPLEMTRAVRWDCDSESRKRLGSAQEGLAVGDDQPSGGDVPPSPWPTRGVVDGLGTSLRLRSAMSASNWSVEIGFRHAGLSPSHDSLSAPAGDDAGGRSGGVGGRCVRWTAAGVSYDIPDDRRRDPDRTPSQGL